MKKKVKLGGMALSDGIIMMSDNYMATSRREADGSIRTTVEAAESLKREHPFLGLPFIRGIILPIEVVYTIVREVFSACRDTYRKSLREASEESEESEQSNESEQSTEAATVSEPLSLKEIFIRALPLYAITAFLLAQSWGLAETPALALWTVGRYTDNYYALAGTEAIAMLIVIVCSLLLVRLHPSVRRLLQYHGAEHQAVHAVEHGRPLTPEEASQFPTAHPRCGSNLGALALIAFSMCSAMSPATQLTSGYAWHMSRPHIVTMLLPALSGISGNLVQLFHSLVIFSICYEIFHFTSNERWGYLARPALIPGFCLQRITTCRPDHKQLEVSCAAARAVIEAEKA